MRARRDAFGSSTASVVGASAETPVASTFDDELKALAGPACAFGDNR
jgi:hypothetical protein